MAKPKPKYGYNKNPRLSANQLAEIVNASPTRRKSIIAAAKFPKSAIVARYKDANIHIKAFLHDPNRTYPNFTAQIEKLSQKAEDPSLKPWVTGDAASSAEALARVQDSYNKTNLGGLDLRSLPHKQPKIALEGVEISASAAASVHGKFKGQPAVGCISLLISKTETSSKAREERCKVSAVLSILYSEQHLEQFGFALPKLNMSYDVFAGKVIVAPNGYKKRLENMSLACEEVALRWSTIEAPDDYDGPPIG